MRTPSFLKKMLEEGEHPVCRNNLHWIYLSTGFFWLMVLAGIGWGLDYLLWLYFGKYIPTSEFTTQYFQLSLHPGSIGWLSTACGGLIFATELLKYLTTTTFVTTKRVIAKTGWLNVRVDGTDISDIRGVHVDQGWFGRFFDYGKLHLDCRFVEDVYLPYVRAPYKLSKHIQEIKSRIEAPAAPSVQQAAPQTIIQIHSDSNGDKQTMIQSPDPNTIVIKTIEHDPEDLRQKIEHRLHDDLLHDFKDKS